MKRTMKKMLSFGLVAAMSLTMLAGCGNSKDATNDTNVSNGQEEKLSLIHISEPTRRS